MQRLFLIILIATFVPKVHAEFCSHEIIIRLARFNHNFSRHLSNYAIDISFNITENLFNSEGKQEQTISYEISEHLKIPKDSFLNIFENVVTSLPQINLNILKKINDDIQVNKDKNTPYKSFSLPLTYKFSSYINYFDVKFTPKARYLERAYHCKDLIPSLVLKTYGSNAEGLIFKNRCIDISLEINDDFNRDLIIKKEVMRKYTKTEINQLDKDYKFDRFLME